MGSDPTASIQRRTAQLLARRPEVTHAEFGQRVGRGYSWVSAFLKGTRPATDIDLICAIAKYFGVTVGYLLGETERQLDPGAATLLATWDSLEERDRGLLLNVVAQFRAHIQPTGPSGGTPPGAPPDPDAKTGPADAPPPNRKRRREQ